MTAHAKTKTAQRDRFFGVRLPKSVHAACAKRAKISGQSVSAWVRDALAQAVGEAPDRKKN